MIKKAGITDVKNNIVHQKSSGIFSDAGRISKEENCEWED